MALIVERRTQSRKQSHARMSPSLKRIETFNYDIDYSVAVDSGRHLSQTQPYRTNQLVSLHTFGRFQNIVLLILYVDVNRITSSVCLVCVCVDEMLTCASPISFLFLAHAIAVQMITIYCASIDITMNETIHNSFYLGLCVCAC